MKYLENYLIRQNIFDSNRKTTNDNLKSLPEEWCTSIGFETDNSKVYKFYGGIWQYYKAKKFIVKFVEFEIESPCLAKYDKKSDFLTYLLNSN